MRSDDMVTKVKNITMIRGDTVQFTLALKNTDIIPDEIWFSVRKNSDAPDYVFQKSLDNGITPDNEGGYLVRIAPEDTQELTAGQYIYDLELKINEDIATPLMGKIELVADVTRRPME